MTRLDNAKRIVIKIGSALIAEAETYQLRETWLASLIADVAVLRQQGKEVIIVSSGPVALGRAHLPELEPEMSTADLPLEIKQALSACGQIALSSAFRDMLSTHGLHAAQMLLTLKESEHRRAYLNARATLNQLLSMGIVPMINENDSITTEEIRVGDNDRLAARVAELASADLLILLSDIDGLYTADPTRDPSAKHIPEVNSITPEIEKMAGPAATPTGTGGMRTKVAAADIATGAGCHMVLMRGHELHPIKRLIEGCKATWFMSEESPHSARKQWIYGTLDLRGVITVDDGAVRALNQGHSLLAVGVTGIAGPFDRGDTVSIVDKAGKEIARGLSGYCSVEASRIKGKRSEELNTILGYQARSAFIHRDDLVMV